MTGALRRGSRAAVIAAVAACGALALSPREAAAALTCTLSSVNTLDFGGVSPFTASATDVPSSFTITCEATRGDFPGGPTWAIRTVNLCASYGDGSGGASPGGNRQLLNGGDAAVFDVYPSAAFGPVHWGSRSGSPTGDVVQAGVTLTRPLGPPTTPTAAQSVSLPVHARLFGGQNSLPPGIYASALTLTVEAFWADVKSDCGAGGTPLRTVAQSQLAQVTYQKECRVGTVNTLDFGVTGFLTANVDAATSVSVTCTSGTPFAISINAGAGPGAAVASRRMTRTSPPLSTVGYGLYRDAARSQNWGDDVAGGSDTWNGTGNGLADSYPIYGRVPPQDTPEPGDYRDTVILSVVF